MAVAFSLFATGTVAHAQINSNTSLYLDANVGGAGTASTGNAGLQVTATTTGSGGSTSNTSTNTSPTASGSGSMGGNLEVFTLDRSDLSGEAVVVLSPSEVSSSANFSAYAQSVMASDENLTKIESSGDSVSIWYKEPAKFMGIVPVMVNTEAKVTVDGNVTVDRPWWYSLFVRDSEADNLETSVSTTAEAIVRSEGAAMSTFSSSAQARLVNALHASMKAHHVANVEADTTTEASTY